MKKKSCNGNIDNAEEEYKTALEGNRTHTLLLKGKRANHSATVVTEEAEIGTTPYYLILHSKSHHSLWPRVFSYLTLRNKNGFFSQI